MTIAFVYWLLLLLWLVFSVYVHRTTLVDWGGQGHPFLFVLFCLIGFAVFGSPIR